MCGVNIRGQMRVEGDGQREAMLDAAACAVRACAYAGGMLCSVEKILAPMDGSGAPGGTRSKKESKPSWLVLDLGCFPEESNDRGKSIWRQGHGCRDENMEGAFFGPKSKEHPRHLMIQ